MPRALVILAVGVLTLVGAQRIYAGSGTAAPGAVGVSAEASAATMRFAPEVTQADRAWVNAAIAAARPEAQRLIAEIDGLVELRTDLREQGAIGLAQMNGEEAIVSVDVQALNGDRALDRNVVILHELGHVIDFHLVSDELVGRLDAGIPRAGSCPAVGGVHTGACAIVEERFADTFAKWALRGRVSLAGSGYGIPAPASLESWGAPLGVLAAQLNTRGAR
jgi:hypothetical protein